MTIRLKLKEAGSKTLKLETRAFHQIVLARQQAFVLDLEDEHFNHDRRVLIPDLTSHDASTPSLDSRRITGVGVIYAALVHAKKNPAHGLFVSGHTDRSGAEKYNQTLSEERAQSVSLLLRGRREEWKKLSAKHDAVDDYQTFLKWQHQRAGWDCDPGPINNQLNARTRKAIGRFQELYNAEVERKQQRGEDSPFQAKIAADKSVGPETWGAFYDIYMDELMDLLGLERYSELTAQQAQLRAAPGMPEFVGCGEHVPFDASLRHAFEPGEEALQGPERNPPDRRVEILFFDPGEEIDLPCHPKPGQCKPENCLLYLKNSFRFRPIGVPKGLNIAEVNLRLTFVDPAGQTRPLPEGLEAEVRFGEPADGRAAVAPADPADPVDPASSADPAAPAEPNPKLEADGLLCFVVPRKASSLYLRIAPGKDRRCVTADPEELAGQRLATLAEAEEGVKNGRVFFQLPEIFDTETGYWEKPEGAKFEAGKFIELDNRETQIGSRQKPVELKLNVRWQYFRFDYFDRWTSSATNVPGPLTLQGHAALIALTEDPADAPARTAWSVKSGSETVHALGWVEREISESGEVRERPDENCLARFETAANIFVRTEGDGSAAGATRAIVALSGDDELLKPGAERLRLYDLPGEWRSQDYPVRLADEGPDQVRLYQNVVATPSTRDKPYVASLDTLVLHATTGAGPDNSLVWDDRRIENRFAIYDHTLAVYRPDTSTGETYFTDLSKLNPKPQGAVLVDLPPFTRLITRGRKLYTVFADRTFADSSFQGAPIGARLGQALPNRGMNARLDEFTVAKNPYQPPRANGSSIGESVAMVLRCCGHDRGVEQFFVVQYLSLMFQFSPTGALPAGAVPLTTPPANPVNEARDALIAIAKRWNGADAVHGEQVKYCLGEPVIARGEWRLILARGAASGTANPAIITVHIFNNQFRAHMNQQVGNWAYKDLQPQGQWYTGAHEIGHSLSLPDEYLYEDNEPSVGLPNLAEHGRSPGTPYSNDEAGMMIKNRKVRTRYFWHLLLWAREQKALPDTDAVVLEHGPRRFKADLTIPEKNRVYFPKIETKAGGDAVGPFGLCDVYAYLSGHDGYYDADLTGGPFDGLIKVRVKMQWAFATTSEYDDLQEMMSRAAEAIQTKFNDDRRLVVDAKIDGKSARLRVFFAPRFLLRTFPTGDGADRYLDSINYPPLTAKTAAAYQARATASKTAYGVHAEIGVASSGPPGVRSGVSPRQGRVRESGFFNRNFDNDVLRCFGQLVGLADGDPQSAEAFRPLFKPLASKMIVTRLSFLP